MDAYYAGSSSALSFPNVAVPLLCIQAADDPIAPEAAIPYKAIEENPNCILAVTPYGGHLGCAHSPLCSSCLPPLAHISHQRLPRFFS